MRFLLYSPVAFENWSWENRDTGIGGSETSHICMAEELAKRGHEVITYAPLPDHIPSGSVWNNTVWHRLDEVNWSTPGVWMIYRAPEALDNFDNSRTDQVRWLLFQDYFYPTLTSDRIAKLHRAVVLCKWHERFLVRKCPETKGITWVTRNGLRLPLVEQVEAAGVPDRGPYRMMFTSSPDRGLKTALKIFRRVKEVVPQMEMVASYGFNNIDKLIARGATHFQKDKDECMALVEETGARFSGRLSQPQLYHELLKTNILMYISSFNETGWISGLEAMALGAIPVFSPISAQGENGAFGCAVVGHPDDETTIARAAAETIRLVTDRELQERIRTPMMRETREAWDWSQFAWKKPGENWEQAAEEDLAKLAARTSAPFDLSALCDNAHEQLARSRWLHLKPGQVMLDVGCADGSWAIPAARQGAHVYAFDPNPDTSIERAVAAAGPLSGVVEVFRETVGDCDGRGDTTRLDWFALDKGLARVDFIKIDVEGHEIAVLHGAMGVIKKFRPRLMVEVHTETVENVCVRPEHVTDLLGRYGLAYDCQLVEHTYDGKKYYHLYAEPA